MRSLTLLALGVLLGVYVGIVVGAAGATQPRELRNWEACDQDLDSLQVEQLYFTK